VHRALLSLASFLLVEGRLQVRDGVLSVLAQRFRPLDLPIAHPAHSFR